MKIHASARTCPNSRKLLVRRIEEENWSLVAAAEGRRHQRAIGTQVAGPLALRRRSRACRSRRGPAGVA
jgi:hypothetical protein